MITWRDEKLKNARHKPFHSAQRRGGIAAKEKERRGAFYSYHSHVRAPTIFPSIQGMSCIEEKSSEGASSPATEVEIEFVVTGYAIPSERPSSEHVAPIPV